VIPLDRPRLGHSSLYHIAGFFLFFHFILSFLIGVQNSTVLHAHIYLTTNSFGHSSLYHTAGFFLFFHLILSFLMEVQNSTVLHSHIYLTTNSFGGRQAVGGSYADYVQSSAIVQKNTQKRRVTRPLKLGRAHGLLTKPAVLYFTA
jgi:hypothetical protein